MANEKGPTNREDLEKLIGADNLISIEAAGLRVVPMEATDGMINGMEEMHMPMGEMVAAWDGAMWASPFAPPPAVKVDAAKKEGRG